MDFNKKKEARPDDPKILTLYGEPKVGKSEALSQLPAKALIIDAEHGHGRYGGFVQDMTTIEEYREIKAGIKALPDDHGFTFVVLDTVDILYLILKKATLAHLRIADLSDAGFGKAYNMVKDGVREFVMLLEDSFPHVIIVGHYKAKQVAEDSGHVLSPATMDLSGSVANMLMSKADANGLVYRKAKETIEQEEPSQELRISFKTEAGAHQAGSRCAHLANQDMPLDWSVIYSSLTKK